MKFVVAAMLMLAVVACSENPGNGSPGAPQENGQAKLPGTPNRPPELTSPALATQLAGGQKLVITLNDNTLVSRLNEISGRHDYVVVESGKLIPGNDGSKGWCELATENGFVSRGDRFKISNSEYNERVYLGATQSNIKASGTLYFQCRKGGMDQSAMLLSDLKTILGSVVTIDLEN